MTGMQWKKREPYEIDGEPGFPGSYCEVVLAEGLPTSSLSVAEVRGEWDWSVRLYASKHMHQAYGYGCTTEGKARFMAMSAVSALLQIIDGVKPHEVD